MEFVEETFDLAGQRVHLVGSTPTVVFRDRVLEVIQLDEALGMPGVGGAGSAVVAWAGGRRRAFGVAHELVGQMDVDRTDLPSMVRTPAASGAAILPDGDVVTILDLGVVSGARSPDDAAGTGLNRRCRRARSRRSPRSARAMRRPRSRGCWGGRSTSSTARRSWRGWPEAADRIGAPAVPAAGVDTKLADDAGRVLLLFPEGSGEELCRLLGYDARRRDGPLGAPRGRQHPGRELPQRHRRAHRAAVRAGAADDRGRPARLRWWSAA